MTTSFHDRFVEVFGVHFPRLYRYLDRLSGDPDLAADVAQEAFMRLYRRGSMPDAPTAWLISVAMNLVRNIHSTRSRRRRLLAATRIEGVQADAPPSPEDDVIAAEVRGKVRTTLDRLPERDRQMLLLQAEGYAYRDIATVLELNPASVGVFLARARKAFREIYGE